MEEREILRIDFDSERDLITVYYKEGKRYNVVVLSQTVFQDVVNFGELNRLITKYN